jgi:glycine oxidase
MTNDASRIDANSMNDKSQSRVQVAVIGGGIAGLACAWALLRRGANVCVFEAGEAGRGALWASGGMLAGGFECAESQSGEAFVELAQRGMELWHDWAQTLGRSAIGFRASGVMVPANSESGIRDLEAMKKCASSQGVKTEWRSDLPEDINAATGLYFPDDGELDNRLLGHRLIEIVRSAGGRIREQARVQAVTPLRSRIEVRMTEYVERFDQIVLATGHSIGDFGDFESAVQHIRPVKGQMLSVTPGDIALPFCLRAKDIYCSQKRDGRIVIGASSEFDKKNDAVDRAVIDGLRRRAESWIPSLQRHKELECWSGVRPSTPDGRPILGPGKRPGVHLALGLYRNGVLLAPAVAEIVADAVLADKAVPAEFQATRFNSR